ncbi:MAG: ATP-binding cassette domain-containing protein [Oscillospiraceae bacterium]|nr:ATP-binding cassette domain-containing protein [Oscillospiraceae bacterium]
MCLINLKLINKAYGPKRVFDKFNAHIETGIVTCITGASGSGKTTLLRIISGLEKPDSGQVEGVENLRKSFVFQEDRLCENLSAGANIRLTCRRKLNAETLSEAMAAVGLAPECVNQPTRNMSGGQRRRVAILRALMSDYDILFMDEPFKGLDAPTKEKVIKYTKEQIKGKTVLLITHDISECEALTAVDS